MAAAVAPAATQAARVADAVKQPVFIAPIKVDFNRPLDAYKPEQEVEMACTPSEPCYVAVWLGDGKKILQLYPLDEHLQLISKQTALIGTMTKPPFQAPADHSSQVYLFAVDATDQQGQKWIADVIAKNNWKSLPGMTSRIGKMDEQDFAKQLAAYTKEHPAHVFYKVFRLEPSHP